MGGYRKFFKDGTGGLRGGPGAATGKFESSEKRATTSTNVWDDSIPVGYWDMSDESGATVSDVSSAGNDLDGTRHGDSGDAGPVWDTTNKVRGDASLNFIDNYSDRVYMADNNALDFNVSDTFSLSCWLKRGSGTPPVGYGGLIAKMAQTGKTSSGDGVFEGYTLWVESVQKAPAFFIYEAYPNPVLHVRSSNQAIVNDENWHHLLVTYDGSASQAGTIIYLDGSAIDTDEVTDTLASDDDILNSTELSIGCVINNANADPPSSIYHFNGNIDEVAIWSKVLSTDEVADVYNSGDAADLTDGIPKT